MTQAVFPCRIGMEPRAEPAGKLLQTVLVDLWRPLEKEARPTIISFQIDRKAVVIETRGPLTDEQQAAIASACKEFDTAVMASSPSPAAVES